MLSNPRSFFSLLFISLPRGSGGRWAKEKKKRKPPVLLDLSIFRFRLNQFSLDQPARQLRARRHAQPLVDALQVRGRCVWRNDQAFGHLGGGQTLAEQRRHLELAPAQRTAARTGTAH